MYMYLKINKCNLSLNPLFKKCKNYNIIQEDEWFDIDQYFPLVILLFLKISTNNNKQGTYNL
jgi:hypothetical protein